MTADSETRVVLLKQLSISGRSGELDAKTKAKLKQLLLAGDDNSLAQARVEMEKLGLDVSGSGSGSAKAAAAEEAAQKVYDESRDVIPSKMVTQVSTKRNDGATSPDGRSIATGPISRVTHSVISMSEKLQQDACINAMTPQQTWLFQILQGITYAAASRVVADHVKYTLAKPSPRSPGRGVTMKDYHPDIFRSLRKFWHISTQEYVDAWAYAAADIPLPAETAGRSGSEFLFSQDKRFFFKTIPHFEVVTLLFLLNDYHAYMTKHPRSRLMRFLGLHRFQKQTASGGDSHDCTYLLVGQNTLWTADGEPTIDIKYDLKGRKPKKPEGQRPTEPAPGNIWKDNQLSRTFGLQPETREALLKQLRQDVEFLQAHDCIDYSLLIGVQKATRERHKQAKAKLNTEAQKKAAVDAAMAELSVTFDSVVEGEVFYISIIDWLSRYECAAKKIAHFCKRFLWTDEELSTVNAPFYANRFIEYLPTIFPTDAVEVEEARVRAIKARGSII